MQKMRLSTVAKFFSFVMLATLVFGTAQSAEAQRRRTTRTKPRITTRTRASVPARTTYLTVPAGERIRVRMEEEISSRTARVGDTFATRVTEPVYASNGSVVIPVGSTVVGRVNSVRPAKKGGDPGTIDVRFTSVRLPSGGTRTINGSLGDLNTKQAKSDNEGTASGDDRKNDKLIFIGGGAAGGAVLGAAVGGGKGAAIGGIIGAVGGLLGERLTKGEEATVRSGTEFGVVLNSSASMPRYVESNN